MSSDFTPMMRQYLEIKEQHSDAILFFRLGDFYEMFFEDAKEATRILHITLTAREAGKGNKVPMCGIPHHAANNYIARLIKQGKKVAICEQTEEPGPGKKLVKREITKIITPGTFIADEILDASVNNYILSLNPHGEKFGLAYADISTGEFRVTELDNLEDLLAELYKISPSECLIPESFSKEKNYKEIRDVSLGAVTVKEDWSFDFELAQKEIKSHFLVQTLEGFGCASLKAAVGSAGALLRYLKHTQKSALANIDAISTYHGDQFMVIDRNSQRNLELTQNMEDLSTRATLLEVLDDAKTPMGKRRLKQWILNPLVDVREINARLDSVQYFCDAPDKRRRIRTVLGEIYDIERLSSKVSMGSANARDMIALSFSLKQVDKLKKDLQGDVPQKLGTLSKWLDDFSDITGWIDRCIADEPPVSVREGGIIRKGYDARVDELRGLIGNSKDWLADLQKQEIERTGIGSLKIGYNQVFGYYIEISNAKLDAVPQEYIRKQTLVNAERFVTPALKEHEAKILGAEERIKNVEYEIFCALRDKVGAGFERLRRTSEAIADMDVLSDLAETADRNRYSRPRIVEANAISIKAGRHPVLERILKDKQFVPNDVTMDDEEDRIFIITGSNMAGKSTFIRQVALLTIMAQIGSFVPAAEAEIGIVDRIFTRVGASDRLYRGMSTFMVEMIETANILNNATRKSLIILDEIGRGTSTFDGVSIAWAVVEFIHHRLKGAKALFATHFHELTELTRIMRGIKNYHLAIQEWGEEVVFLYKVKEGSCDESFGIHVAKLAGMPGEVVKRAREILSNLQRDSFRGEIQARFAEKGGKDLSGKQLEMFLPEIKDHPILEKIKNIDADKITPMEALLRLSELKKELNKDE